MRFLLNKGLVVDASELETNTLAGIDNQVEVLLSLIDIHALLLIHGSHINGILYSNVYKLGQDNTGLHAMEEVVRIWVYRKELCDISIFFQEFVGKLGEAHLLLNEIRMGEATISDNLRDFTI